MPKITKNCGFWTVTWPRGDIQHAAPFFYLKEALAFAEKIEKIEGDEKCDSQQKQLN